MQQIICCVRHWLFHNCRIALWVCKCSVTWNESLTLGKNTESYLNGRMNIDILVFLKLLNRTEGFPGGSDSKESACNAGDLGLIPGLWRFSGEGHDLLQYSCLENPMDRGAWWAMSLGLQKVVEWLSTAQRDFTGERGLLHPGRLIHVEVWQKPTKFCKAFILQLKKNKWIKKKNFQILLIKKEK